ncbi:hypothetical protein Tco_0319572 [Tanacetum coccineum]
MLKAGFSDSGGGGRKKKKSNTNVLIGSCSEYKFPSLSVGAGKVHTRDGGVQEGNDGNYRATRHVHEVTNDGNPNEVDLKSVMKEAPSTYANKLSLTSLTKANLQKLDANVPNDADFDIWLPLASVHEGRSNYVRILIEIDACNGFSDNLVMAGPNLEGPEYTVDKGKGGSLGDDDEDFIEVKKKKSGVSPKTAYSIGKKNVSTSCNSLKTASKTNASTSGYCTFSLSNSFEPLNVDEPVTEEVESEGKCVLVDDDGNPLDKVDYSGDHGREDEVEPVDNEITSYLASKSSGVGYGTNSLLEQWTETYGNAEYDYDPYDDDMYEGQEIPNNIQSICDNLDIKVRG